MTDASASPWDGRDRRSFPSILADWLIHSGIREIFFVSGAHIDFLLQSLMNDDRLVCLGAVQESTAAFMADGVFRSTGRPAAVLSIGGPGGFNMLTAAYTAARDHVPTLFLTGDVPSSLSGYGGFQDSEAHGSSLSGSFEQAGCLSVRITDIPRMNNLFERYMEGLQGGNTFPLHLSIPCDISMSSYLEYSLPQKPEIRTPDASLFERTGNHPEDGAFRRVGMLCGHRISDASMRKWIDYAVALNIPVAVTMEAFPLLSDVPTQQRLGLFGYAGHHTASAYLLDPELDMLILVGVELTERNTLCWHEAFWHPRRLIRIVSPDSICRWPFQEQINPVLTAAETVVTDQLTDLADDFNQSLAASCEWRSAMMEDFLLRHPIGLNPIRRGHLPITVTDACTLLGHVLTDEEHVFADAGDHRYFAAHMLSQKPHPRFFSATNTAPMGWAIGAGIGSAAADRTSRTYVITGDGCVMMHGNEMSTAVRYCLPITFIMMNNNGYGKIRRRFFAHAHSVSHQPGGLPDIAWDAFLTGLRLPFFIVNSAVEMQSALEQTKRTAGPNIIVVQVIEDEPYPNPSSMFTACASSNIGRWQKDNMNHL
jgi:acetolactate synthase-1/2/3 large subunit